METYESTVCIAALANLVASKLTNDELNMVVLYSSLFKDNLANILAQRRLSQIDKILDKETDANKKS